MHIVSSWPALFEFVKKEPKVKEHWVDVYEQMIVHTRGVKPTKLLEEFRPNEPADIREYRLKRVEPITEDAINRGKDALYRSISQSNYTIQPASGIREYIETKRYDSPGYLSDDDALTFREFMFREVIDNMIDDPNGALMWMPVAPDGEDIMPSMVPPNTTIEVSPMIVRSEKIVYSSRKIFAWEAEGLWQFTSGNETINKPYYYVTDNRTIFRVIPVAMSSFDQPNVYKGVKYEWQVYYELATEGQESWPMLPRIIFGGHKSRDAEGRRFYKSFFSGFVPFGNEALCAFSENQAVRVMSNFPIKEEKGQVCKACDGSGKQHKNDLIIDCTVCDGSGRISGKGPYGVFTNEPPANWQPESIDWAKLDAVKWYYPGIDILKESWRAWEDMLLRAEKAVNIEFIEQAQSGVAKEVDREKLYDMLNKIAKQEFYIIKASLDIIQLYRVLSETQREENVVIAPNSFSIYSQDTLIDQIEKLRDAPMAFAANNSIQLAHKVFHGNNEEIRIIEVITRYDKLFNRSVADIISMKAGGLVTNKDLAAHDNAYNILKDIVDEWGQERFLKASYMEIKEEIDTRLEPLIPAEVTDDPFSLVSVADRLIDGVA